MKDIRLNTTVFSDNITEDEVKGLRGIAISHTKGANTLFHNHLQDGFNYTYPLIQYKAIGGHAAIVCLQDGCDVANQFLSNLRNGGFLNGRRISLEIASSSQEIFSCGTLDYMMEYAIKGWLPFNQQNYCIYRSLVILSDKIAMLERLLCGNILSFAKGIGLFFDEEVVTHLTDVSEPIPVVFKGQRMLSFDASFITNVSLPNNIGLGKGVSIGHGTICQK